MLKAGYLGVKAGDPNAVVISGALTPTGVYDRTRPPRTPGYLDQLYQWNNGEIRQYYDVLGIAPLRLLEPARHHVARQPQPRQRPFTTHGQFYFRRIEEQRAVMEKHGEGEKQVWLTEFGWCSDPRRTATSNAPRTTLDGPGQLHRARLPAGAARTIPGWA